MQKLYFLPAGGDTICIWICLLKCIPIIYMDYNVPSIFSMNLFILYELIRQTFLYMENKLVFLCFYWIHCKANQFFVFPSGEWTFAPMVNLLPSTPLKLFMWKTRQFEWLCDSIIVIANTRRNGNWTRLH